MKQLHSFDELRQINRKIVYALGTFDGVHRGHQRVIGNAIAEAKAHDAVTVLVTFSAHPMTILRPGDVPKRVLSADIMDEILSFNKDIIPTLLSKSKLETGSSIIATIFFVYLFFAS